MAIVERWVRNWVAGKQEDVENLENEIIALEMKFGYPPRRVLWYMAGNQPIGLQIVERQWESLAAMESAMNRLHPEIGAQRIWERYPEVQIDQRLEILFVEA